MKYLFMLLTMALIVTGCEQQKFPGHPERVMIEYAQAIQRDDFATIYRINMVTARQEGFIQRAEEDEAAALHKENVKKNRILFDTVDQSNDPTARWYERFLFPASATFEVGTPRKLGSVGDDPVNADYEEGNSCVVPVSVTYSNKDEAPLIHGEKVKQVDLACTMNKIRQGLNVRIYSHDDKWYFAACVPGEMVLW